MSSREWLIPDADGWHAHPAMTTVLTGSQARPISANEEQPPTYRVAAYTVYPTGFDQIAHPHKHRWCVTVADAGDGWAIRRGNKNLNIQREWEYEPPPGVRDAAFLRRCRFNEHAALLRARRVIDKLTIQGLTFKEFVEEVRSQSAHLAQRQMEKERGVSMLRKILDWHAAGKPQIRSEIQFPRDHKFRTEQTRPGRRPGRSRLVDR